MEHAIYSVTLLAFLAVISHVQAQEIGDPQKGLALGPICLFRVSCDRKRTGWLAEPKRADFRRACKHSWNDDHRLVRGAYDATR
jgi:hypothetical protein